MYLRGKRIERGDKDGGKKKRKRKKKRWRKKDKEKGKRKRKDIDGDKINLEKRNLRIENGLEEIINKKLGMEIENIIDKIGKNRKDVGIIEGGGEKGRGSIEGKYFNDKKG